MSHEHATRVVELGVVYWHQIPESVLIMNSQNTPKSQRCKTRLSLYVVRVNGKNLNNYPRDSEETVLLADNKEDLQKITRNKQP